MKKAGIEEVVPGFARISRGGGAAGGLPSPARKFRRGPYRTASLLLLVLVLLLLLLVLIVLLLLLLLLVSRRVKRRRTTTTGRENRSSKHAETMRQTAKTRRARRSLRTTTPM